MLVANTIEIMKKQNLKITCTNCKTEISLDSSLMSQFQESVRNDLYAEFESRESVLRKSREQFNELTKKFYQERKAFDEMVKSQVEARLKNREEEIQTESLLKVKEKETIIESLRKKLDEARQKVSQGSMQLQGEAQELLLEEILADTHGTDKIEEIKKGANGADCIQTVITQTGKVAGKILYESKNTKNWSDEFIKKLKQDNLTTKADVCVIVTKTMPKEVTGKYALIDGVWVTTLSNVRDLSLMIRFGLLKVYAVIVKQTGKKDKMNLLYDYLTSQEFKDTFESILEGFKLLQDSHNDEQRKMQLLWKKREKHLSQVLTSTIDFYGSIKGISGDAIPEIKMLQFPKAG